MLKSLHRIKNGYIFVPTNKLKHKTMTNYLNTLITEKGLNREMILEVQGQSGLNIMPLGVVLDNISATSKDEQKAIKNILVKIDFQNGNIMDFFKHLAQAIAR